jgi:uncharacterized membrane protein YqjE
MANDLHVQSPPEPSVTALVSGIIHDIQELLKQQVTLFRVEIREDLRKTKEAVVSLAAGLLVTLLGAFLLSLALPLLLWWAAPALPPWACFAIVGGALTALGAILLYAGVKKLEAANPLHDQSVEALKENVQWLTNPK